ncbi:MAG: hypothetical protein PHV32_14285 [Eubacteriales bacterium]|nr:hypothetical protein [Eubacteriales bacterium]
MKTEQRIEARVSLVQKKKIAQLAEKCGLPQSEYIRQRALGYSPRTVLPDAFYSFRAKLCELCNSIDGKVSGEAEEKLLNLIDDIRIELLLSEKETVAQIKTGLEGDKEWQPQDSGQSKES